MSEETEIQELPDGSVSRPAQGLLYLLEFPCGKSYVGITSSTLKARLKGHVSATERGSKLAVHCAIRKYGLSSVTTKVLAVGTYDFVKQLEVSAIRVFSTLSPNGYNLTIGGDGVVGNKLSQQTKETLSRINLGKVIPKEVRQKISATVVKKMESEDLRARISEKLKGKTVSAETRDKLRKAALARYSDPNERRLSSVRALGRKASEETRAKLSASLSAYYQRLREVA